MSPAPTKRPTDDIAAMPCCTATDFPDAELFRALADPSRLAILAELASCCGGSMNVSEVADGLPKDLSVVSRHLATLRDAGVLRAERHGREVRYFCCYEELVGALRSLADAIEACCPANLPDGSPSAQTPSPTPKGGDR